MRITLPFIPAHSSSVSFLAYSHNLILNLIWRVAARKKLAHTLHGNSEPLFLIGFLFAHILYPSGLNIDYYPTNFIPENGLLYYIDYECNQYSDEWNFENWGIKYWIKNEEDQIR